MIYNISEIDIPDETLETFHRCEDEVYDSKLSYRLVS